MKYSKPLDEVYNRLVAAAPDDGLHGEARSIAAHVGTLVSGIRSLESMAEKRDPTITDAAHQRKVAEAAKRLDAKAAKVYDAIQGLAQTGYERLEHRITDAAGLRVNEYAAEIREAVRAMKPAQRRTVVKKAVDDGDAATLAALDAPSVVTGLDPAYMQRMRSAFVEQHAPAEHKAYQSLDETLTVALKAASDARGATRSMSNPRVIQDIERRAQQAEEAQQSFSEAMASEAEA